jgi:hypothetical protein
MNNKIRLISEEVNAQFTFLKNENLSNTENAIKSKKIYDLATIDFINFEKKIKFSNSKEEVEYFKKIKAKFISYSFYFDKIIEIEKLKIFSPEKEKIIHRELKIIEYYKITNIEFYNYYSNNETHFDVDYFSQSNCSKSIFDVEINFLSTKKNEPLYDIISAHFIANELLEVYLINELHLYQFQKNNNLGVKIKWTKPNAWLTELMYGLWFMRCINDGNISIAELTKIFNLVFDVELGDTYHTFSRFKNRKESVTLFSDLLKEAIIKKIEEDELKIINKLKY